MGGMMVRCRTGREKFHMAAGCRASHRKGAGSAEGRGGQA